MKREAWIYDLYHRTPQALRLPLQVLFVGIVCSVSTEIGFAHKVQPHNISALWPTTAVLLVTLLLTPVRHWWCYAAAAYFTSIINDAMAGFPVSGVLFLAGGLVEIVIAAVGVRSLTGFPRSFDSLSNLVAYIVIVTIASLIGGFIAAFAGGTESYWFYWRTWFLSELLAFLLLAPAILNWIAQAARPPFKEVSHWRLVEGGILCCLLFATSLGVFFWPESRPRWRWRQRHFHRRY